MPDARRVNIYIDGSNLYHSLRNATGRIGIDFGKFVAKLVENRRLVRAYYYNAPVDQTKPESTEGHGWAA